MVQYQYLQFIAITLLNLLLALASIVCKGYYPYLRPPHNVISTNTVKSRTIIIRQLATGTLLQPNCAELLYQHSSVTITVVLIFLGLHQLL